MTSKGLRLFAYGRVSDVRGRSGEAFISPEDQMKRCRDYASAYDHTILEEGLDLDVSGGVMTRPVLDRFLGEIRDGKADGLIVAKLDRFARSSRGALNALAEIESAGGVLISVQEQIDSTTAAGRFVRSIFLATAEWERERIGENWKTAKESAVARGIHISRHVPPGYERGKDRRLVTHRKHGKTISEAFKMAAAGDPYARIAAYLNERGLPLAGEEGVWQPNRIKRLLANRVYLGEARSGPGQTNPNAHEALTDLPMFQLAQRDRKGPVVTASAGALLAGLCRCASCSFSMRSQAPRKTKNGESWVVGSYRCTTSGVHGRCPAPSSVSLMRLEEFVISAFLERVELTLVSADSETDPGLLETMTRAEQSYKSALTDTELRRQIGDADHSALVSKLYSEWQTAVDAAADARSSSAPSLDSAEVAELVGELQKREDVEGLRELLASAINAVFVRPAASRSKTLPIEDRVRIVWRDEDVDLVLPKRGERFEPRAFAW